MVVKKAVKMARLLGVAILGLIENMTLVRCPKCGEEIRVFGRSGAAQIEKTMGVKLLGELPLDPVLAEYADRGEVEEYVREYGVDFLKTVPGLLQPKATQ